MNDTRETTLVCNTPRSPKTSREKHQLLAEDTTIARPNPKHRINRACQIIPTRPALPTRRTTKGPMETCNQLSEERMRTTRRLNIPHQRPDIKW